MSVRHRVVATLLVAVALTGCAQEPTPLEVRAGGVEQPTTDPVSTEEDAGQRAQGVVGAYFSSADGIFADPSADLTASTLAAVSEGSATTAARVRAGQLDQKGLVQTGRTEVTDLEVTSVDLEQDDSGEAPVRPTVLLTGCIDRSEVRSVDGSGKSAKDPALRSVRAKFSVRNTAWPDVGGWRLAWFTESKTRC